MSNIYTIDFETYPIVNGSNKPPIPVGVSIKFNNEHSEYFHWESLLHHQAILMRKKLKVIQASGAQLLFHNAKFDLRIAQEYFDLPMPNYHCIIDTMIMAYLVDPREASLGLKELAQKYCGMKPYDQQELHDWIRKNEPKYAQRPGAGTYLAPSDLVGKYACSDTDMTYSLYQYFKQFFNADASKEFSKQNISNAFDREMAIIPISIKMEQQGVYIAPLVHQEKANLESSFNEINNKLTLISGGEEPGSKAMYQAFRRKGLIDESKLHYTDKGNPRYGKEFVDDIIADKELAASLKLRSRLQKIIGTYLKPFSESAIKYDGKFYPYYNQTRSENDYGTKTGRFSSNIQQLPKNAEKDFVDDDGLPHVRRFIVPSPGKVFIKRDFSGQELRVSAHYAEGAILKAYQDDPKIDVHQFVSDIISENTGIDLDRGIVKTINFLKLYGGGASKLASRLGISLDQARAFFQAYDRTLPEFKKLMKDIEKLSRSGKQIRTWGGRSYDVEAPKDGKEFYYKLGNVLIQGSSADMTKEAMIRYFYHPDRKGNLVMVVHDELVVECLPEEVEDEMALLRWAMDDIPGWDVPLRSDGSIGYNLYDMEKYVDEN